MVLTYYQIFFYLYPNYNRSSYKLKYIVCHYYFQYNVTKADTYNTIIDIIKEPYPSAKDRKYPYYHIYVKNFVIYYVVIDDEVEDFKIMEARRILYSKWDKRKLV